MRPVRRRIQSVALSTDGATAAVGRGDAIISLWHLRSAREVGALPGHAGWVRGPAFSADGGTLLSGGNDGVNRVWDVAARRQVRSFRDAGGARAVAR